MKTIIDTTVLEAEKHRQERANEVRINTGHKSNESLPTDSIEERIARIQLRTPQEQAVIEATMRQEEEHRKQIRSKELFERAEVPKRHAQVNPVTTSGKWAEALRQIRERLAKGFMMALVGRRGNGKTQIGVELLRANAECQKAGNYLTATGFFLEIKHSFRKDSRQSELEVIQKYTRWPLLVLDEFGQKGDTAWEDRLLFEMLNRRYNGLVDTLIISNHDPAVFVDAIGASLASRHEANRRNYPLHVGEFSIETPSPVIPVLQARALSNLPRALRKTTSE